MRYRKLGSLGPRGLGDLPRLVAHLLRRRRVRPDPRLHRRRLRGRHQLLRHRQRLRPRRGRGRVGRDPLRPPARLLRAGDQGVGPDVGRPGRPRPVGGADRQADRRLARAPADRPRRPLPGASLRPGRARSRRRSRRSSRSSPPARRATSASASGRPSRSRRRSTSPAPTCSSPRSRSTRCCGRRPRPSCSRSAPANGISQIVWSPLGPGAADRQVPRRARRRRPTRARRAAR